MIKKALLIAFLLTGTLHGQQPREKILVAYFSKTGTTRALALQVQQLTGGDLFEIVPAKAYPAEYRAATTAAMAEQRANARPALEGKVGNMESYGTILLGFPNWWGTMPMALFTFLESYDLAGKTIIPFATHGGSGLSRSEADIKKLAPRSALKKGFAVKGAASEDRVRAWLKAEGVIQ